MFIGEHEHTIDAKGRVAIPAKFRSQLGDGAIVTRGIDRCLFAFTASDWHALAEKLVALPLAQANSRAFVRLMLSGAAECELDSQGRALIPERLRDYAGIRREVIVAGLYNRIEIWDKEAWSDYKAKTESSSEEIAEKLGELGV
ncbi:MAG: division/cell wall cluster transcriptional repressor MraZ [Candidatus Colwellbacteria bacterium]|nr:division/cell wall cluster transcriptional repressor MraZ [Candidatus Colwellbacteria bacterium]